MARKPRMTAGFITACCFIMVSKTSCSNFSGQGSYYSYTHTFGLNFTMKSWAEFLALMNDIMHGQYLTQTQLLYLIWWYRLWAACPCLSSSAVTTIGEELDSCRVTFHERATHTCLNLECTCPFVQLKFPVYGYMQTDIYTYTHVLQCSHASVGLVQAHPNNTLNVCTYLKLS